MKIEGSHICEHCGEEFEWFYQASQKWGSNLEVETKPVDKIGLYQVGKTAEKDGYKIPLEATAYCPKCDCLNDIKIKQESREV